MYLETRDLGDMMDIYFAAWERGVKTTYYLHMKPRHTAEQSTVKVNKSEDIEPERRPCRCECRGIRDAAAPAAAPHRAVASAGSHRRRTADGPLDSIDEYEVPVDPMDDLQCDSCQ